MKRKILFLLAAMLLMSGLTWAQSDYSTDYTGNITLSTEGGTNASTCKVVINGTQYDGIKAGTGSNAGSMIITVPANTQYLHMHVSAWKNENVTLEVSPTGYSDGIDLSSNTGISGNSPFTFDGDPSTSDYYKVIIFAAALAEDTELTFTATGGKRFVVWGVTSEEGGGTPTVVRPSITPDGGNFVDSQEVSISCTTPGAAIYYTTNGNDPTTSSTLYTAPFTITATTTVKAFAVKSGYENSNIASAVFTKVTAMTVAEAIEAIDDNDPDPVQNAFVSGIVSQVDEVSTQYGNATYWISDDGTTNTLEVFRGKYLGNGNFTSTDQIQVGDEVVVYGTLQLYNSTTYEFAQGNYLISLNRPAPAVEAPTFSPEGGTYTEIQTVTISCATPGATIYYTTDGTQPDNGSTLYLTPITVNQTTTIKAIAYDSNGNNSAVATVTYTINLPVPEQAFNKIDGHNVVEGQTYLIVDLNSGKALTSANGSSSAPTAVEVAITNDQIITNDINLQWIFESVEGGYVIHPADDNAKWLYSTDANNGVRVGTNENKIWTLDITDETNTDYHGFKNNATSRYLGVYNSADWRAYTSVNNNIKDTQIALFVLGDAPTPIPSFTIQNNNEIAYNATSGSFNFTVNNPVAGGVSSVAENVAWISNVTIAGNSVTFTTTVNNAGTSRQGVITLTYTYNRATVTKDVTVTQAGNPNVTMTIAEVRAQGTGDVTTEGTVTSCAGTTGYIQDATAAICVYGAQLTVGDQIRVSGTLSDYHGLLEITDPEVTVLSQGNVIQPTVMSIADILTTNNQGWYVRIEEATVTEINNLNVTIAQDDATIVVRFVSADDITFSVSDMVSLTGNIGCYNNPQIANPTDVVVQVNTTPNIVLDEEEIFVEWNFVECNTITYEIEHPVEGVALQATTEANWITIESIGETSLCFVLTTNSGSENRVGIITLSYQGATDKTVTVTQGYEMLPGDWELVDLADLVEGDVFVIVGTTADGVTYAMTNDNGASDAPAAISVAVVENTLSGEIAGNLQWNISGNATDGYTFYPNGDNESWLYCTNANNGVRVGTNENNIFTFVSGGEVDEEQQADYLFNIATERYVGIYATNPDWRCYTSINNNIKNQSFAFYKKTSTTVTQTIALSPGWNWFSANVEITLDDLKAALVAALPNANSIVIKAQSGANTTYNGSGWRGQLNNNNFNLSNRYNIKVFDACEIVLTGMAINPAELPITISNGVNWIAFPLNESMTVGNAFGTFPTNGDIIKAQDGSNAKYNNGSWRPNNFTLEPGQGYLYKSNGDGDTFFYPEVVK